MAESSWKETVVTSILSSVPILLIFLGVVFVVLGLAGGITYHSFLVIAEPSARILSGIFGVLLFSLGIGFSIGAKSPTPNVASYGIKIQVPAPGDHVESVDVRGTIERAIPDGYCLRVFRIYPGSDNFVPLAKARIDISKHTWIAERCNIGGKTGDRRTLAVYLVGPSGEVLVAFHNGAVTVHRATMDELRKATGVVPEFLPSVAGRTNDMLECDRVAVVHS